MRSKWNVLLRWSVCSLFLIALLAGTVPAEARNAEKFLLVWAGDHDDQHSDFLAVVDADPRSATYGKVLKTVTLPEGVDKVNEPHHMTHHVTPNCKLFAGGLLSGYTFVFDVKNPLRIPAPKVIPPTAYPFLVPDDFTVISNGNVLGTYVSAHDLVGPGGIVEFDPDGNVIGAYQAGTDEVANPHGISVKEEINRMVTTDFGTPLTLFLVDTFQDIATHSSLRVWDFEKREPLQRVDLPTGPRYAASGGDRAQRETYAVMETAFLRGHGKTGFFASAMGGGGLFFCPDATAADVQCHLVHDYGYNSGAGSISISEDDKYLIQPLGTLGEPGLKRIVQFDITDPMHPRLVAEIRTHDPSTGGPHFGTFNHDETRFAWTNFFVDDSRIAVKVDGNHRLYLANRVDGKIKLDRRFRDEIDGRIGVNFNRERWPHGRTGFASPHGVSFAFANCVPEEGGHGH